MLLPVWTTEAEECTGVLRGRGAAANRSESNGMVSVTQLIHKSTICCLERIYGTTVVSTYLYCYYLLYLLVRVETTF